MQDCDTMSLCAYVCVYLCDMGCYLHAVVVAEHLILCIYCIYLIIYEYGYICDSVHVLLYHSKDYLDIQHVTGLH